LEKAQAREQENFFEDARWSYNLTASGP